MSDAKEAARGWRSSSRRLHSRSNLSRSNQTLPEFGLVSTSATYRKQNRQRVWMVFTGGRRARLMIDVHECVCVCVCAHLICVSCFFCSPTDRDAAGDGDIR